VVCISPDFTEEYGEVTGLVSLSPDSYVLQRNA
jgi:hypothetical protein